jgi:hypothetical protein
MRASLVSFNFLHPWHFALLKVKHLATLIPVGGVIDETTPLIGQFEHIYEPLAEDLLVYWLFTTTCCRR